MERGKQGKKGLLKKLKFWGWNLGIILLFFALVEGVFTFWLEHPEHCPEGLFLPMRAYHQQLDRKVIQFLPECAHYDSTLFYALNPGTFTYENREFNTIYEVNSAGFRDEEASLDYPEVLVIGDSYTMGWGVEQSETYSSILEEKMGKKVLNTGVSSYGTAREVISLHKVRTDSVKLVILQYCPNDLIENKNYLLNDHKLKVSSRNAYEEQVKWHRKTVGYFPFKHVLKFPSYWFPKESPKNENPTVSPLDAVSGEQAFLSILRDSPDLPKTARIVVFELEAERVSADHLRGFQQELEKEFASSLHDRMDFMDLTGHIGAAHRFHWDPHLNAEGHAVVAERLLAFLEENPPYSGTKSWFYPSGDTSIVCDYVEGLKEGSFRGFHENGRLSVRRTYRKGLRVGEESFFDPEGKLVRSVYWEKGQEVPGEENE